MITPVASYAHLVSLDAQSSTSTSSSSINSPSTGSSTPATSSSTSSPSRVSEIAREALLPTSPIPTSSSTTLIGESEALMKWRASAVEPSSSLSSISSTSSIPDHTSLDHKQLLMQAEQHFSQTNIIQALQCLDLIPQESPNFLPALRMRLNIHRIEFLKTRLAISFKLGKYKEVRTTAESILNIQPYNQFAIGYMEKIHTNQILVFKEHLKDLFKSKCYDKAARIAHILLDIDPDDRYVQEYLKAIQQCTRLPTSTDQPT